MNVVQTLTDYETYSDYRRLNDLARAELYREACIKLLGAPRTGTSFGDQITLPGQAELKLAIQLVDEFIFQAGASPNGGMSSGYGLVDFQDFRRC